jgi:hypothetical protein
MTLRDDARFYADECKRLAEEPDNEEHRETLLEMASAWVQFANREVLPVSEARVS